MASPHFHRLQDPGALDYRTSLAVDWINNTPGDPSQAPAATAIVGPNPYAGSFFIGGQEDATDLYANRAHLALASNCDLLFDRIHRPVAYAKVLDWNPPSAAGTYTFPTDERIYVGDGILRPGLFSLVCATNQAAVIADDGSEIRVLALTCDPPDAAGFTTNVRLLFTAPVPPDARHYMLTYGACCSVAELPENSLSMAAVLAMVNVPNVVEYLLMKLHAPIGSTWQMAWDDAWSSTVFDLSNSGLNERYCRASDADIQHVTSADAWYRVNAANWGWPSGSLGGPGAGYGSWVLRDGMALSAISLRQNATPLDTDKAGACWRASLQDASDSLGGSSGFMVEGAFPSFLGTGQREKNPGLTSFVHVKHNRMDATDWYASGADAAWTVIGDGANATVTYFGGELVLTLGDPDNHFWRTLTVAGITGNFTSIATGMDMIEVLYNGQSKYWLLHQLDSVLGTQAVLRELGGSTAPAGVSSGGYPASVSTPVQIRWHSPLLSASDGAAENALSSALLAGFTPGADVIPSPGFYGMMRLGPPHTGAVPGTGQGIVGDVGAGFFATNYLNCSLALAWGCRALVLDTNGQSTPNAYGCALGNGYLYAPKVFVDSVGKYDPFTAPSPGAPIYFDAAIYIRDTAVGNSCLWTETIRPVGNSNGLALMTTETQAASVNHWSEMSLRPDGVRFYYLGDATLKYLTITALGVTPLALGRGIYFPSEVATNRFRRVPVETSLEVHVGGGGMSAAIDVDLRTDDSVQAYIDYDTLGFICLEFTCLSAAAANGQGARSLDSLAGRQYRLAIAAIAGTGTCTELVVRFMYPHILHMGYAQAGGFSDIHIPVGQTLYMDLEVLPKYNETDAEYVILYLREWFTC